MSQESNLRYILVIVIVFVMTTAITSTFAQMDTDGDGLVNNADDCPFEAGPRNNGGCPIVVTPPVVPSEPDPGNPPSNDQPSNDQPSNDQPSNDQPPNDQPPSESDRNPRDSDGDGQEDIDCVIPAINPPPGEEISDCPEDERPSFTPPSLPDDACYVTSNGDFSARVRVWPSLASEHIGNLMPGVIYPATGIIFAEDGVWIQLAGEYQHLDYEMWGSTNGYVSTTVVNYSKCTPVVQVSNDDASGEFMPLVCEVTVGFESSIWSEEYGEADVIYATFLFATAPGNEIVAGMVPWDVTYIAPEWAWAASNLDNLYADTTDPVTLQTALDAGDGGEYDWPTPNGRIVASGHSLYRLAGTAGGDCGRIINERFEPPITSNPGEGDVQVLSGDIPTPLECIASPTIEMVGNDLFYYPNVPGVDPDTYNCSPAFNDYITALYQIQSISVTVQHEIFVEGEWEPGPETISIFRNWYEVGLLGENSAGYWNINGGIWIEGHTLGQYNRYRLIVTIVARTAPGLPSSSYYTIVDAYTTDWLYGPDAEFNPATEGGSGITTGQ